jgi:ABC-type sugar transport system ATPase subunit
LDDISENLIEIRDLKYSRGHRAIFDGLNLTIKRGEITALMGPSGTGKTTLLRLITRQLIPEQGVIYVGGVDISTLNQTELYEMRQRFGMLFQNGALLTDLTVFENVGFPLREHTKLSNRLIRHVVLTKLHAVGLRGAGDSTRFRLGSLSDWSVVLTTRLASPASLSATTSRKYRPLRTAVFYSQMARLRLRAVRTSCALPIPSLCGNSCMAWPMGQWHSILMRPVTKNNCWGGIPNEVSNHRAAP